MVYKVNKIPIVCVCFASDDNYAPYLQTTINSILCNRNIQFGYDILILHANISENNQKNILHLGMDLGGVSIRFIDVSDMEAEVEYETGAYYSIATNYRLLLFSEMFSQYDRIIYLDCDMIVLGDISELFTIDLEEYPIAAVLDVGLLQIQHAKRAVYIGGNTPYSVENYKKFALGMKCPQNYFNAGMIVFDLGKCRELYDLKKVVDTLHSKQFTYNDQDTLNILFDGKVKLLDVIWNYQNNIEVFVNSGKPEYIELFQEYKRSDYKIIHYIGPKKPWNETVKLGDHYTKYVSCHCNVSNGSE